MRPSFLAHILNGLLLAIGIVLFVVNYKSIKMDNMIGLILLLSIAIGVHGIMHHYEEIYYGFNPLRNQWKIRDKVLKRN